MHAGLDREEFEDLVRRKSKKYPQLELYAKDAISTFYGDQKDKHLTLDEFKKILEKADSHLRSLPATAQVAAQQGEYLAKLFNDATVQQVCLTNSLDAEH